MRKSINNKMWIMALFLGAFVTGCGGGGSSSPAVTAVPTAVTAADSGDAINGADSVSAAAVPLGTAANYAILAKTAVTTAPPSAVTGNIGLSPAATSYLTGFSLTMVGTTAATSPQVTGTLYAADMTAPTSTYLTTATSDVDAAYTAAAAKPTTLDGAHLNTGGGDLGGLTLPPGVYQFDTSVTIATDLTLDGLATDVWVFKVAGTLDEAADMNVTLTGGALPQNVFWQVAGAVTVGARAHFEGIILGKSAITFGTNSSIKGRLLSQTAVTINAATVTVP